MKKALDFLIIFLLAFLVVNLFVNDKKKVLDGKLIFSSIDSSYSIPASVGLEVKNNTPKDISFNTCKEIQINNSWEYIKFDKSFCKDINIKSWKIEKIDYTEEYKKFSSVWNYIFEININGKKYLSPFEITNPWTFKKLFTTIFYAPIYNLMAFLIDFFGGSLGWSIIVITIIIRIILLWPQHKMMVSQKKLQAVQPKIKKIQEQYKWQQQVLWMKLMELYKKEKVNPMWSCGFLIIQMPILLVIYNVILSIQDISNGYYLYPVLSSFNLASTSYSFFWIDLLAAGWVVWIILWLTVWIIQYIQVKLSLAWKEKASEIVLEKNKWDSWYKSMMPDPDMMNKFMLYWMPAMVAVFTFTLFAWVGMYWWMSTLFMIFQQLIVNKIVKK